MFETPNSAKEDIKRDGLVSQIIKRLGALELFMRTHLAVQHYIATTPAPLPKTAVMWQDQSIKTVGNAFVVIIDAAAEYCHYMFQSLGANGDTWFNGFYIRAGTYTFKTLSRTDSDYPKVDYYIDSVLVGTIDYYSAALTRNVVKTIVNVTISTDGYHTLKAVINGKNAASAGYNLLLTKLWFEPAAY